MPVTAESICAAIHSATKVRDAEALRVAALDASKFLRSRLSESAYMGTCHHCDEADRGEPCPWCGLVSSAEE